jgi:hypothetical protein
MNLSATVGPGVERVDVLDGGCGGQPLGSATYGISRPDVAEQYGEQFAESGWEFVIDRLTVGEHELAVPSLQRSGRRVRLRDGHGFGSVANRHRL